MSDEAYARVLREAADQFVLTVAVVAEREGRGDKLGEFVTETLRDALARLGESGALNADEEADGEDD